MSSYEEVIEKCKQRENPYFSIEDVQKDLINIENVVNNELLSRFENDVVLNKTFKEKMRPLVQTWKPQIDWDVVPSIQPQVIEANGAFHFSFKVAYRLILRTESSAIDRSINQYLERLKQLQRPYLRYRDEYVLSKLQQIVMTSNQIQKEKLECFLEDIFKVKLVAFEGEYSNGEYFRFSKGNIPQAITSVKAIVSQLDNTCIEKGIYVEPINDSLNDE